MKRIFVACLIAGCATFEDPTIVLDLRVLGMSAEFSDEGLHLGPEQMIEIDVDQPPTPSQVLAQLEPTRVCALVADPGRSRRLRWSMTMCLTDDEGRCDRARPHREAGSGLLDDPDEAPVTQQACAEVFPDQRMFEILFAARETDILRGLGGIDFVLELRIGGELADPATDVYASKTLRVSPRIPRLRDANRNPYIDSLTAQDSVLAIPLPALRCGDPGARFDVPKIAAGATVTLYPNEPAGVREDYVVPTLDGHTVQLTETLTYQWLAGRGSFSDATTGGGHDVFGGLSLLGTEWNAPDREFIERPTLVPLWMIQRDERLGVSWFETCVEVLP